MDTFAEYWKRSPGLGSLSTFPPDLVLKIAESAYTAGQESATRWCNEEFEKRGFKASP